MRRVPVTVLTFVVLMLLPPAATAASGADPSNPSLDQYVESVPSSHGGSPPGPGSTGGHASTSTGSHLPASIRHRLAATGGPDATQLQAIATSPAFGAPADAVAATSARRGASDGAAAGRSSTQSKPASTDRRPSGFDAVATAATSGEGSSSGLLLGGLVLISALALGTVFARRRVGAV